MDFCDNIGFHAYRLSYGSSWLYPYFCLVFDPIWNSGGNFVEHKSIDTHSDFSGYHSGALFSHYYDTVCGNSTLFLFLRKKVIAFGLTLLFLLSSDFALLETPPYLSFKPVIFTSSYSFSFFIQGDWISNLIYAYFCPIVIGLILVILCKTCIWRRNLW